MLLCVTGRIGANPVDGLMVVAVGSRSSLAGSSVGAWTLLFLSYSCNKTGYIKNCLSSAVCCLLFLVGCGTNSYLHGRSAVDAVCLCLSVFLVA